MKNNQSTVQKILKSQTGFSLIELMIVIGILGLLIGLVGPKLIASFDRAKVGTTQVQMKQLVSTMKSYRLDCGNYPTTDQGLESLIKKSSTGADCKNYAPGGYVDKKLPKDAWDQDFLYNSDGNTFEIKSLGADKKEGGVDFNADIIVGDQD
ncbi:MAG: type II secretion system major pseudopilin GspG [Bdellovibrionales bacterium]|nr:type II secretion system major pseudopilin GspG [Oligoflexia bacterium]